MIANHRGRAPWTQDLDVVFLVGAPRSGTTWLQSMVASHPHIYTGTETLFFMTFGPAEKRFFNPPGGRRIGIGEYLSKEQFYNFMGRLFWCAISALPEPPSIPKYFLEKTNSHCLYGDFILNLFPNARFIHLIRDGRAVVDSLLRASNGWGADWAPRSVDEATKLWALHVRASRKIRELIKDSGQYIEVRYEDLRKNPYQSLSELFKWLALPVDKSLVGSIIESNSLHNTLQSKEPFGSIPMKSVSGVEPKVNTAYPPGFIGPAPSQLNEISLSYLQRIKVELLVGDLLRDLGYPDVRPPSIIMRILTSTKLRRTIGLPPL
jgi:hypothetical protein